MSAPTRSESAAALDVSARYHALLDLLEHTAPIWRPAPFQVERPEWCAAYPDLTAALIALDDETLAHLTTHPAAARSWLGQWLPGLAELETLLTLPAASDLSTARLPLTQSAIYRGIPGRKAAQIDAFAVAVGRPDQPLAELCAGKGHLGRRMLVAHGGEASALELDPRLCADGTRLSQQLGVAQRFVAGDVHDAAHVSMLVGAHVLALHACGDLHRRVLSAAVAAGSPAIDVAPCCYQKSVAPLYQPCAQDAAGARLAKLGIDHNILHLSVTGLATATTREARIGARQQAWRLAFVAWRGERPYQPFMPVPAAWWPQGFTGFFTRLAEREGYGAPAAGEFSAIEAEGWRRWAVLQRMQLVRFAFRRAIEVVLLLDMARWLQAEGYRVRVGEFCPPELTPRNLLLSARLL